jgi:hypothetical protein
MVFETMTQVFEAEQELRKVLKIYPKNKMEHTLCLDILKNSCVL